MTGDLILYCTAVALLFGLAGLALERIAAWRGLARRGAWMAAQILSVAIPTLKLLPPHRPAPSQATSFVRSVPWSEQSRNIAATRLVAEDESASLAAVESVWQRNVTCRARLQLRESFGPYG